MANDTMNDILGKVKDFAKKTGEKTSEVAELSKLKLNAASISSKVNTLYLELGRLTYDANKKGEENAEIAQKIEEIDQLFAELEGVNQQINLLKNQNICPACGAPNSKKSAFCNQCGTKLDV